MIFMRDEKIENGGRETTVKRRAWGKRQNGKKIRKKNVPPILVTI